MKDVFIFNALLDFGTELRHLLRLSNYEIEPDYDNFISCFDQGLSEEKIKASYKFVDIDNFENGGVASVIGHGKQNYANKKRQ